MKTHPLKLLLLLLSLLTSIASAHYDPAMGRWLNRDPVAENGGENLYGFVGNDGVNKWDLWGMQTLQLFEKLEDAGKAGAKLAADNSRAFDIAYNVAPPAYIVWKREYAGLVCAKCDVAANKIYYLYTNPHPGRINGPFPRGPKAGRTGGNSEQHDYSVNGGTLGPASASSDPGIDYSRFDNGEYVSCESRFGVEWKQVGKFHSHPFQSGSNPSDIDKANKEGGRRFLGWDNGHGVSIATEY
jgi:uncharacterized protein RhaS with RHS repeats